MQKRLLGRSDHEEKVLSHNSSHHHTHTHRFWSPSVGVLRLVVLPNVAFRWGYLTEVQTRHSECPQKYNSVGILPDNCAPWTLADVKNNGLHGSCRAKHDLERSLRTADLFPEKRRRCEPQRSQRRPTGVGEPHETHRASAVLNTEDTTDARDPSLGQAAKRCAWRDH